jgi:hypothetical protein
MAKSSLVIFWKHLSHHRRVIGNIDDAIKMRRIFFEPCQLQFDQAHHHLLRGDSTIQNQRPSPSDFAEVVLCQAIIGAAFFKYLQLLSVTPVKQEGRKTSPVYYLLVDGKEKRMIKHESDAIAIYVKISAY